MTEFLMSRLDRLRRNGIFKSVPLNAKVIIAFLLSTIMLCSAASYQYYILISLLLGL